MNLRPALSQAGFLALIALASSTGGNTAAVRTDVINSRDPVTGRRLSPYSQVIRYHGTRVGFASRSSVRRFRGHPDWYLPNL